MAQDSMNRFVDGMVVHDDDLEPLRTNILDLDTRLSPVEELVRDEDTGNRGLGHRVDSLESGQSDNSDAIADNAERFDNLNDKIGSGVGTNDDDGSTDSGTVGAQLAYIRTHSGGDGDGGGSAITKSGFLNLDPDQSGFAPSGIKTYEVYKIGSNPSYIEFPNPQAPVTVYGNVASHVYSDTSTRVGMKVQISLDGGSTWKEPSKSPLAGVSTSVSSTAFISAQYAVSGTPTGSVRIRATAMKEATIDGLYRTTLYANMLGGDSFTTG